jgi:hypothetical protein
MFKFRANWLLVAGADLRLSCISHNVLIHASVLQNLNTSASVGNSQVPPRFVLDLHATTGVTFDTQRISLRIHQHG